MRHHMIAHPGNKHSYLTALCAAAICILLSSVMIVALPLNAHADSHCTTVSIDVGIPDQDPTQDGVQVCQSDDDPAEPGVQCSGAECNVIFVYLRAIINFLAVGVGLAVAVSIAVAGFQYITSEGNPQKLSAAKNRLFHAITALVLFITMYAILQFLIPGGLV